jgi:hypothetical protein
MNTPAIQRSKTPEIPLNLTSDPRTKQKLHKFFGADPSVPAPKASMPDPREELKRIFGFKERDRDDESPKASSPVQSPLTGPTRPRRKSSGKSMRKGKYKNLSAFFGERPPDEMIVDQLEQFFPGIGTVSTEAAVETKDLKNILQANIIKKRNSQRMSSVMLRRQSANIFGSQGRPKKAVQPIAIPEDEEISAPEKPSIKPGNEIGKRRSSGKLLIKPVPQPITFRWAPGNIIGQGAFGKVFHALNLDTGEFMAVKQVVGGGEAQQKKSFDSLQREIDLLKDLNHENIVRYLGILYLNQDLN